MERTHAQHRDVSVRFLTTIILFALVGGISFLKHGFPSEFGSIYVVAWMLWIGIFSVVCFSLVIEAFDIKLIESQRLFFRLLEILTSWWFLMLFILFTIALAYSVEFEETMYLPW